MLSDFNETMDEKLFIYANEMFWKDEKKKGSILKKLLTIDRITINIKYIPHRCISNRFNMIFATNEN
jgi:Family of unknown function (DUF5906)